MKIKLLLLVGIGFAPYVLVAQTAPFLYNKGIMSVKSTDETRTTLYIGGDFVAGHDATTPAVACQITLEKSQTVLTGNFIHDLNGASAADSRTFNFSAGDLSRFVFRGTAAQKIMLKTGLVYGGTGANNYPVNLKGQNYIDFPTLVVENDDHVTMVPELAAQASNLLLNEGRLILDSRRIKAGEFVNVLLPGLADLHGIDNSTMLAHFMVNNSAAGAITAPNNATVAAIAGVDANRHNKFGAVQVNLELNDPATENATEFIGRSLIGLGSPYNRMLSDYFFWNFQMFPRNESLIGGEHIGSGNTSIDPQRIVSAGEGFVIGIDLRGTPASSYEYDLHPFYKEVTAVGQKPDFAERVTEKYEFSRFGPFFNEANNVRKADGWGGHVGSLHANIKSSGFSTDDAYLGEVLNYQDVGGLEIQSGYNYYSNPYTVPLSVSEIVGSDGSKWGGVTIASAPAAGNNRHLSNRVWVLDPTSRGSGNYHIIHPGDIGPGNKWVMVDAKYRVIQDHGSTYDPGTGQDPTIIAPLQMFVLYSPLGGNPGGGLPSRQFNIPASARRIANNAYTLRSTATQPKPLVDDFLFNVTDENTKSLDRVAIVIRTPQDVMTNANYAGVQKLVTIISSDQTTTRSTTVEGTVKQTNMSTLYTKSGAGVALESNVLGVPTSAETESVGLYLSPSFTDQNITISAGRLATAKRVIGIMLKDKLTNNEFDLFGGESYTVASKATDPVDRFTLRFVLKPGEETGIEDSNNSAEGKSITSYYQNGTLTVAGFDDVDLGSAISVYDIQGRMVAQAKVDDTTVAITQSFSTGAYIVKVVGNKSYAAKFLVR